MLLGERDKLWKKLAPKLAEIRDDIFEMQILKLFDFTAWIESKLCKTPLDQVLKNRITPNSSFTNSQN